MNKSEHIKHLTENPSYRDRSLTDDLFWCRLHFGNWFRETQGLTHAEKGCFLDLFIYAFKTGVMQKKAILVITGLDDITPLSGMLEITENGYIMPIANEAYIEAAASRLSNRDSGRKSGGRPKKAKLEVVE